MLMHVVLKLEGNLRRMNFLKNSICLRMNEKEKTKGST